MRQLLVLASRTAATLFLVFASALATAAEPRLALVVGNQTYSAVTPLDNPLADAQAVAEALERKGFAVTLLTDADQVSFNRAIAQFGRDLRANGEETVGLFYYAGHAVQSFGANYLLPVDVALTDAADLSLVAVRADAVLRQMASAANHANVVILDACRNNPFVDIPDMNDNGLAEMKAPGGTFMAYSTAPGSVALDGVGDNSPYTAALVAEMDEPGLTIEQTFKQVRAKVQAETGGRQMPWDTSSLTMDIQFTPAQQLSPEEMAAQSFFESIQQTRDPVQIVLFLRTYPDSVHFDAARALLSEVLDGSAAPAAAAIAPSPEPSPEPAAQAAAAPRAATPPAARAPDNQERGLIEAAQASGKIEDYRAYLDAFPEGVFAELATMEIETLVAKDPEAPPGGLETAAAPAPETAAPAPAEVTVDGVVTFDSALAVLDPAVMGKSISTLIEGSPLFPPIDGLPDEVWKDRACSTCHVWSREALCDQGKTYLAASGTRALTKEHPYGGGFKNALRTWAGGGCQ